MTHRYLAVAAPGMAHARELPLPTQATNLDLDLSLADAVALGLRGNRDIRLSYLQRVAQEFDLAFRHLSRRSARARNPTGGDAGQSHS